MRKHIIANYIQPDVIQMPPRHKYRICRKCNGVLGAAFENSASGLIKRLIDAESFSLDPREQLLVGRWIAKTVLLTCLADSKPENWGYEIARKKVLEMMASGVPPVNTSVRLARMEMGGDDRVIPDNYTGNLLPAKMPDYAFFGINVVGNLCFELVTGIVGFERYVRWIDRRTLRFIRIWPTRNEEINWPPPKTLHMKQVDQMRQEFMKARINVGELADPRRRTWDSDGYRH
ncbi:MAG TPA: hypothetical protein VG247_20670 [Pseudonocardiaceae bacterium]|jgi:hypothetical protein|nr:hypothetical protein [Pseudonocardiaceae bacterium]